MNKYKLTDEQVEVVQGAMDTLNTDVMGAVALVLGENSCEMMACRVLYAMLQEAQEQTR